MSEKPITNFDQLYPGRFLKAGLLEDKKVTLTIKSVYRPELESEKGKERKATLIFDETEMELIICKTNGLCLKEMFGPMIPDWIGKKITIFADQWNGEPCIRIWGSPHLTADRNIEVKLPRRAPMRRTLHAVPGKAAA